MSRLPAPIDRFAEPDLDLRWGEDDLGDIGVRQTPISRPTRTPLTGFRVIVGALILAVVAGCICYQVGHVSGRQETQVAAQATIATYTDAAERATRSADYWRAAAIDASATADALESDLASITAEWQRQTEEASATILILQQQRAAKRSVPRVLQASTAPGTRRFSVTAYCSCIACCGKSNGITASGAPASWGTIAAGAGYPFGTRMTIEGFGDQVFTVRDRGGAISSSRIDIWFPTHAKALAFGRRTLTVAMLP